MKKYRIRKNSIAEWAIITFVGFVFWSLLFFMAMRVY